MKYKCDKCDAEFEAKMDVKCPKCGESMELTPVYKYARKARVGSSG